MSENECRIEADGSDHDGFRAGRMRPADHADASGRGGMRTHDRRGDLAFSLVEVMLSVGIIAFAFVGILGLLPAGMTQFRGAMDTTVCAQIAQRVIGDAQQTDFNTLIDEASLPIDPAARKNYTFRAPRVSQPEFRYFDERGVEVVPTSVAARANPQSLSTAEKARIIYHVNVRVMPQTVVPRTDGGIRGGMELATLTIQVATNPSHRAISIGSGARSDANDPTRQLFVKTPGVPILTFAAQVARNL